MPSTHTYVCLLYYWVCFCAVMFIMHATVYDFIVGLHKNLSKKFTGYEFLGAS